MSLVEIIRRHIGERRNERKRKAQLVDYVDKELAAKRVNWAREALKQRPKKEDWHEVIFSDEVHFGYGDEGQAQRCNQIN